MRTLQEQIDQVRRVIDDIEHVRPVSSHSIVFGIVVSQINQSLFEAIYRSLLRQRNQHPYGSFTAADYQLALNEAAQELEGKANNGAC